jgi:hypothetical protein
MARCAHVIAETPIACNVVRLKTYNTSLPAVMLYLSSLMSVLFN